MIEIKVVTLDRFCSVLLQAICVLTYLQAALGFPFTTTVPTPSHEEGKVSTDHPLRSLEARPAENLCCSQAYDYYPWRDSLVINTDPEERVLCPYVLKCQCDPDVLPSQHWVAELDTSQGEPLCETLFTNAHCEAMRTVMSYRNKTGADGKYVRDCGSAVQQLKKIAVSYICMADSDQLTFRVRHNQN